MDGCLERDEGYIWLSMILKILLSFHITCASHLVSDTSHLVPESAGKHFILLNWEPGCPRDKLRQPSQKIVTNKSQRMKVMVLTKPDSDCMRFT